MGERLRPGSEGALRVARCVFAVLVIATGFSSVFLAGPATPAASGGSASDLVSLAGSAALLLAFLILAWYVRLGIRQIFYAMVIIAMAGVFTRMLGWTGGALPTFGIGPLFIGAMLASLSERDARRVVIVGFGCAAIVYPLLRGVTDLSDPLIVQLVSVAFYIAAGLFMLCGGDRAESFAPLRLAYLAGTGTGEVPGTSRQNAQATQSRLPAARRLAKRLRSPRARLSLFAFIALALYFAYFGICEVLVAQGDAAIGASNLSTALVLVTTLTLYVLSARLVFGTWAGLALGCSWVAFIASLLVVVALPTGSPWAFAVEGAVAVVLHIVVWLLVLSYTARRHLSPIFFFALVTAVMKIVQMLGRVLGGFLVGGAHLDVPGISVVAACFLGAVSVLGGALAFVAAREARWFGTTSRRDTAESGLGECGNAMGEGLEAPDGARASEASSELASSQEDLLRKLCRERGLSEREVEIVVLYCLGRSAPAISRQINLAEPTVRTYIRRAYGKLGVHARQELLDLIEERQGVASENNR